LVNSAALVFSMFRCLFVVLTACSLFLLPFVVLGRAPMWLTPMPTGSATLDWLSQG
jgi:hypothetical protein